MIMDFHTLANEIADGTPAEAAAKLAQLIRAVRDLFSARQVVQFESALTRDLAKLGYRFERDTALVPFRALRVGEEFVDGRGRRCRRIEPVEVRDFREGLTLRLEAAPVDSGEPFHIAASQIVRRVEPEGS
jgi:hypothetical protein